MEDYDESESLSHDEDPINFWEKKQRELLTSVVDYNLESISQLISRKAVDLSPKYQRRFRWDDERKSKLIESFLMNVPIPPIFLNEDKYGKYSVIDGKQRLSSVHEFMTGKLRLVNLEVFSDINGMTFDDLPSEFQNVIKTRPTVRAIIILRQSDRDVKFEVFQRLNTGGVRLNPQEIRNSTYPGPLNNLILTLSEDNRFHKILGIKSKNSSSIYKEMKDCELVLRFFTFKNEWESFPGGMKHRMDYFMVDNQHISTEHTKELSSEFFDTLEVVETCFGDQAFKRWLPDSGKWKKKVSAPLFDAQIFAFYGYSKEQIRPVKDIINKEFKDLFTDLEFLKAIESSTGAPSNFLFRINKVKEIINRNVEGE